MCQGYVLSGKSKILNRNILVLLCASQYDVTAVKICFGPPEFTKNLEMTTNAQFV